MSPESACEAVFPFSILPFSILHSPLALAALMSGSSPGTPARALSPAGRGRARDAAGPDLRKNFEIALCNTIDFDNDFPIPIILEGGLGILACIPRPPLGGLPGRPRWTRPSILWLKVEVERLVEELAMVRSRAELFASAHVATVTAHAEERAGLFTPCIL